jgi:hypothetical protein
MCIRDSDSFAGKIRPDLEIRMIDIVSHVSDSLMA